MHVYLTGATGFIGSYVLRALLERGHTVRCLLRDKEAPLAVPASERVERVRGDVTEPRSLAGTMRGCDAVIHLVGIIEEQPSKGITFERIHFQGARNVIDEAVASGIERFVLMSANGARPDGVSAYQTTKWRAEEHLRGASIPAWTILRPSLVFGDPGPDGEEFATRLARTLIKPFPILPVFGDGQYRMQPVSVEEVSAAFVQALDRPATHGQTYVAVGQEALTFVEILDTITRALGMEPKPKLYQPLWLVRPIVHTLGRVGLLPVSPDQFEMLIEGNTGDPSAFYRDFDLDYRPFTPETLAYVRERA
ncbi:MAG: NAD-dependent nucleoside diphosphate-sugar epimerase/dehydratase [Rhodothermaceae bacterium]|nr:MAG: complex I NDUFA9 subunit family protein [Bacteroidota bacterium]GIV62620.1 MAG: NAD-dependent nucleoside diphosphate-sugar epimerase/dehydratase [Rhodothermaceae bacterium]